MHSSRTTLLLKAIKISKYWLVSYKLILNLDILVRLSFNLINLHEYLKDHSKSVTKDS